MTKRMKFALKYERVDALRIWQRCFNGFCRIFDAPFLGPSHLIINVNHLSLITYHLSLIAYHLSLVRRWKSVERSRIFSVRWKIGNVARHYCNCCEIAFKFARNRRFLCLIGGPYPLGGFSQLCLAGFIKFNQKKWIEIFLFPRGIEIANFSNKFGCFLFPKLDPGWIANCGACSSERSHRESIFSV